MNGLRAKPQSVDAITFSRPTISANRIQVVGDKFRMFDHVRGVADQSRQHFPSGGDFRYFPNLPSMLMPDIGGLEAILPTFTCSTTLMMSCKDTSNICDPLQLP